jgi:DNA polymerase
MIPMLNFYDFECYPKLWTVTIINPINGEKHKIVNDVDKLKEHYAKHKHEIYVGFNNRQYDDYMFKAILCGFEPWEMNQWLIQKGRKGWEFSSLLQKVKLNSFDCMVGFNGLKTLEAFSGMSIQETKIPFDYDGEFTQEMIDDVLFYNEHDVMATIRVFMERKSEFDSYMGLIKLFDLPLSYLSKSKAQLAAIILGAKKTRHNDEYDISIPYTLRIEKYTEVVDYFTNDWNYETGLEIDIAGVPHVYGTGGIHGAIPNYFGKGEFLHVDVNSYYPSLMLRYPEYCMSRTGASVEKFQDIYDNRISFKKQGDPRADALKIVLNSTYGAMKDVFNPLFDPRSANNVCIFGQLLLTDLIERLESVCDLIQSNTDGLIIKLRGNRDEVVKICKEWEARTGMGLGYEVVDAIWQKDVNNYIFHFADVPENGRKRNKYESKGAYVKKLNNLDYDLAIVNKAVTNYLVYGMKVEDTVYSCQNFRDFQKVVKLSNKYKWVEHEYGNGTIKFDNKAYRVFASLDNRDGRLLKCDGVRNPAKFGNTPDRCFIFNDDLTGVPIPSKLDREYYVALAKKRLEDFGI